VLGTFAEGSSMTNLIMATEGPCQGHLCDNCSICRRGRCCRRDRPDYHLPEEGGWEGEIHGEMGVLTADDEKVQCHICGRRPHQRRSIPPSWRGTIRPVRDYNHHASWPPARRAGRPGRAPLSPPGRVAVGDRVAGGTPAVCYRFLVYAADAPVREAEHATRSARATTITGSGRLSPESRGPA